MNANSIGRRTQEKCLKMARKKKPPDEPGNSVILTKQQAAAYVQSTPRYLERMVRSRRLRAFKPTGRFWRVRRSDLDAFLESGATIGDADE